MIPFSILRNLFDYGAESAQLARGEADGCNSPSEDMLVHMRSHRLPINDVSRDNLSGILFQRLMQCSELTRKPYSYYDPVAVRVLRLQNTQLRHYWMSAESSRMVPANGSQGLPSIRSALVVPWRQTKGK
jgi:hypothetical protein